MVAGLDINCLVATYDMLSGTKDSNTERLLFDKQKSLYTVLQEMGNPFLDKSTELIVCVT